MKLLNKCLLKKYLKLLDKCKDEAPVDNAIEVTTPSDHLKSKSKAETLLILYRNIFSDFYWEIVNGYSSILKVNGELVPSAFHDWSTADKRKWLRDNVNNIVYAADVLRPAEPYRQQRDHIAPTNPPKTYTTLKVQNADIVIANNGQIYYHYDRKYIMKCFLNLQYHLRYFYTYRNGLIQKGEYRDITSGEHSDLTRAKEAINKYER